jgi:hypothetical protein
MRWWRWETLAAAFAFAVVLAALLASRRPLPPPSRPSRDLPSGRPRRLPTRPSP